MDVFIEYHENYFIAVGNLFQIVNLYLGEKAIASHGMNESQIGL